ncbi:sigma-B regulation protein RsbU (phosphoserine phosphatase) [Bacillus mesophilus]|uniref:SpoIIE family protein phosphatase n=1 Tax=Bacillus mesophilus TaxID=1808955 RepID=A0A6M0Q3E5_9BACI|nr:SpoIIE family protein phosphatase [Bacillus mesophilus]MBM7660025.1 sigma-B regulation protein RsbU (phosphoserine phosphatase) [Bacillus mesophilus]NEY70886.1 SpoIIE family protein phosphatase [Bacillus mesophilus]
MIQQLDEAPCGYVTLNDDGFILSINKTLLDLLGYGYHELQNKHINHILPISTRAFYQMYFFPMIRLQERVEEIYFTLLDKKGDEVPVLLNAKRRNSNKDCINECIFIPMYKRYEFESEILKAKREAETALQERNKVNQKLKEVLHSLEVKQSQLIELYQQNQEYQEKIKIELDLAKSIQNMATSIPISNGHLQIETYYKSSSDLSGDIFGCYQIDEQRYGIIILDVMGHGISSALITMSLRSLYQSLVSKGVPVDEVIQELDNYLHVLFENNSELMHFSTVLCLVIDTDKQEIEYINAGHPTAIMQGNNKTNYDFSSSVPPIGLVKGINFMSTKCLYEKGSRLLLYTDGVLELIPLHELRQLVKINKHEPLSILKEKIIQNLKLKEEYNDHIDDQCFILIDL